MHRYLDNTNGTVRLCDVCFCPQEKRDADTGNFMEIDEAMFAKALDTWKFIMNGKSKMQLMHAFQKLKQFTMQSKGSEIRDQSVSRDSFTKGLIVGHRFSFIFPADARLTCNLKRMAFVRSLL